MSEYVIGERIEPGKQPYALSKLETKYGVGLRIYGTESGTGGAYSDGSFVDVNAIGDSGTTYYAFRVGDEPLYEGYVDTYELRHKTDTDTETIIDILSSLVTGDSIVVYNSGAPKPFSFIYRGGPQMFKIDEHIATITIEDEAVVQFSRQHPVYGIYGEDIKASFDADFEDTDQGVYDTSATGTTIMENHQQKDTIYLKGTGTVTVWAGLSAVNFPFKAQGKGGGSGGGTIYRTTTALTDGATTNPITVDGEPVTVKSGDFAIYSKAEFVFDGTQWDELGDTSGFGDLAYKDSASGTANVSVTGTTDGSVTINPTKETIYSTTNKGTLPAFTYNSTTEELTFNAGTLPSTTAKSVVTNATATFTGASTTSTGTVNVTVS